MKKILFCCLALIGLTIYACSSDSGGGSASNPNDAAKEFDNPTGSLSSANVKDVSNTALKAKNANTTSLKSSILSKQDLALASANSSALSGADIQACTSTSGSSVTIDWECLAPKVDNECTGSGTTVTTNESGADFYTIEYNDFGLSCSGSAEFTCNGNATYSTVAANLGVYCSDLTCKIDDVTSDFNGCVNVEGDLLIRVGDESFVLIDIDTPDACDTVTMSIRDKNNTSTITCNVSDSRASCSTLDDVTALTGCTIN